MPPQLQLIVVLGSQYAALAKNVNGLNADICVVDSVVMDWRFVTKGEARSEESEESARVNTKNRDMISANDYPDAVGGRESSANQ